MVCFHRDRSALRQADSRDPSVKVLTFDPRNDEAVRRSLLRVYDGKVAALAEAANPWLVVHSWLDAEVEYNVAWAQTRAIELVRQALGRASQVVVEGAFKIDEGVRLCGEVAQIGHNGDTVVHGYDEVSGTFRETIVEHVGLFHTEVYCSWILRGAEALPRGPLSSLRDLRISNSIISGTVRLHGVGEMPDGRGKISTCFVEGAQHTRAEEPVLGVDKWERGHYPEGSTSPKPGIGLLNWRSVEGRFRLAGR